MNAGLGKSNLDAVGNVHTISQRDHLCVTRASEHLSEHGILGWPGQQVLLVSDFYDGGMPNPPEERIGCGR